MSYEYVREVWSSSLWQAKQCCKRTSATIYASGCDALALYCRVGPL